MAADDLADSVAAIRKEVLEELVARYAPLQSVEDQWDVKGLAEQLQRDFAITLDIEFWLKTQKAPGPEDIAEFIMRSTRPSRPRWSLMARR
jgi:preprotein translocase subunit SecA